MFTTDSLLFSATNQKKKSCSIFLVKNSPSSFPSAIENGIEYLCLSRHCIKVRSYSIVRTLIYIKWSPLRLKRTMVETGRSATSLHTHEFWVLFGLDQFSKLYVIALDFKYVNDFRINHSKTKVSLKPCYSVIGVISLYCFSITWYLAILGKKCTTVGRQYN